MTNEQKVDNVQKGIQKLNFACQIVNEIEKVIVHNSVVIVTMTNQQKQDLLTMAKDNFIAGYNLIDAVKTDLGL
jgi:hypothetical protein